MIKFRAWDKENRKIRDILSLHTLTGMAELDNGKYKLYPDEIIVMQSTGHFDINSQEIFEGDVVKIRDSNEIGIVKRDPHEPRLFVDYNKGSKCKLQLMELVAELFFTVIGNVYENRDLLENL